MDQHARNAGIEAIGRGRSILGTADGGEDLHGTANLYRLLFENNPLPTWIFDCESLRFLAVNEAAVRHYGYTHEEFLDVTIMDIRPPEEVPRLRAVMQAYPPGVQDMGVWTHRKKDGTLIDVELAVNDFASEGWRARLVVAHDVTAQR